MINDIKNRTAEYEACRNDIATIAAKHNPSVSFAALMSITEAMLDALPVLIDDPAKAKMGQEMFGQLMVATGQNYTKGKKTALKTPEQICEQAGKFMQMDRHEAAEFFASEAGHFHTVGDKQVWLCPQFVLSLLIHMLGAKQ